MGGFHLVSNFVSSYIHNYEGKIWICGVKNFLTMLSISVPNKDSESGKRTVRAECFRSMRKSQNAHSLSVRESCPAGSMQAASRLVRQVSVHQIKFL